MHNYTKSVYRESERKKALLKFKNILNTYGGGVYKNKPKDFVLKNPIYNLWYGIRFDAINYFNRNKIEWWESDNGPSGHLLSSQIACLNFLYPFRQRKDIVIKLLQNINDDFVDACILDDGYIEFEYIGKENYLKEINHKRGKYSTSIDAAIIAKDIKGNKTFVMIEWKFTEFYETKNKLKEPMKGKTRKKIYFPFLKSSESPFITNDFETLFYEPFYQLMRQTLLAEQIIKKGELGMSDYIHIHVIPKANKDLIENITSPGLKGSNICDVWKSILKHPGKFKYLDTSDFIKPALECIDTESIARYLKYRYSI